MCFLWAYVHYTDFCAAKDFGADELKKTMKDDYSR